jgi:hypothetical protein
MVGTAGLGQVDDQALAVSVVELKVLVREGQRADLRVPEHLLAGTDPAHFVAVPQPAEVRALDQQFTDEGGQLGRVLVGPGHRPELGHAAARLLLPVGPQVARGRVQERVPDRVAMPGWPVEQAGVQPRAARVGGQHVAGRAQHVRRVRP